MASVFESFKANLAGIPIKIPWMVFTSSFQEAFHIAFTLVLFPFSSTKRLSHTFLKVENINLKNEPCLAVPLYMVLNNETKNKNDLVVWIK